MWELHRERDMRVCGHEGVTVPRCDGAAGTEVYGRVSHLQGVHGQIRAVITELFSFEVTGRFLSCTPAVPNTE